MPTYREQVLADGAVLYMRLDEPSGTTAASLVGGYTGTISGGVTLAQPGALADGNAAMAFDGVNDYIIVANGTWATFGTNSITIECWVRETIMRLNQYFVWCGHFPGPRFSLVGQTSSVRFHVHNGSVAQDNDVSFDYGDNVWHHIVGTITRGASDTTNLYIDGTLRQTLTFPTTGSTFTTSGPIHIGSYFDHTTGFVQGSIDEVAVYHTALTPQQIANHYALRLDIPSPPPYSAVYLPAADRPFNLWQPLTPSDQTDRPFASLWCGTAGTVAAVMQDGVVGAFTVPAGAIVPIMGRRVNSTGTSVTSILALGSV